MSGRGHTQQAQAETGQLGGTHGSVCQRRAVSGSLMVGVAAVVGGLAGASPADQSDHGQKLFSIIEEDAFYRWSAARLTDAQRRLCGQWMLRVAGVMWEEDATWPLSHGRILAGWLNLRAALARCGQPHGLLVVVVVLGPGRRVILGREAGTC